MKTWLQNFSSDRDGFALIAVLVLCPLLIPVIGAVAQSSKMAVRIARASAEEERAEFAMAGIADTAAVKLSFDRQFLVVLLEGSGCTFDDNAVFLRARDHGGKIDLNNAQTELLHAGFEAAGFTAEQSRLLQEYAESSRSGNALPPELVDLR